MKEDYCPLQYVWGKVGSQRFREEKTERLRQETIATPSDRGTSKRINHQGVAPYVKTGVRTGDGSVVKNYCSCRGPGFNCQESHGSPHLSVSPVPRVPAPSSAPPQAPECTCACIFMQTQDILK